ncbi:phosphate ABC transporter substrate-binding protein [Thiolapillus brandeum]|uniref:Phosphate transport system substrate-binding protein n=1 Tax=Thiolapillus brandeum TaxID=1076588 RepID=A0A7U6GKF7_9GAMM|nr:phosphate ABC transporter substrate-binding protein [Thiolapillus brandeum]BAO45298.1 phosphate transport system substrate-binding protein [Thiolapillus brandeum]
MKYILLMALGLAFAISGVQAADTPDKAPSNAGEQDNALHWAGCGITKKAFMKELSTEYEKIYGVPFVLEGGGATKGIRRVKNRSVDLGGSCRPKLSGVAEERFVHMTPVAWDALVVMVHKDNPVSDISLGQIKDLYEGKITNWKELGGNDAPVELLVRKGKISGVGYTLRRLIWGDPNQEFKGSKEYPSSGPLEKAVETNPNAIGISGISSASKRNVKLLSVEGKTPSFENIQSGNYLMYRPLYITYMTRNNPRIREVKRFISFALSKRGRAIIRAQGVVPYLDAVGLTAKQKAQRQTVRELQEKHFAQQKAAASKSADKSGKKTQKH